MCWMNNWMNLGANGVIPISVGQKGSTNMKY